MGAMEFELDHVFVCMSDDRKMNAAIAALSEFGLDLSKRSVHRGQGTRNACAFFDNAYLELLCRADDTELESDPVVPLMLRERLLWRETGACPFGVSLRPVGSDADHCGVKTWAYTAPYLPDGTSIPIVTPPRNSSEPLVFLSSAPPPAESLMNPKLFVHRGKRRTLTGVRMELPQTMAISSPARAAMEAAGVGLEGAERPHLEVEWDAGREGRAIDFGHAVPISIRW
jgi:hypothetical protein